jgi:hypothetical protein
VRLAQLRTGLDAQLPGEQLVPGPEGGQRLGLPAAPVQRHHQQRAQPLPQRVLDHQPAQLGHALGVPPQPQLGLQPGLQYGQPLLVELRGEVTQHVARRVGQGRSAPQRQRLAQQRARFLVRRGPGGRDQAAEAVQVDLVGLDVEQVPGAHPTDRDTVEQAAQPVHVHLEVLPRRARRLLAPDRLHQPGYGDQPARLQQQRGEHVALLGRAEVQRPAAGPRLDRAEQPEFHGASLRKPVRAA